MSLHPPDRRDDAAGPRHATDSPATNSPALPRALGAVSLALAGAPTLAPRAFCAALGLGTGRRQQLTARAVGLRELGAAALLFAGPAPVGLWARVAGDAMDLAVLGRALADRDGSHARGWRRTVAATATVAGITALDAWAAITRSRRQGAMELTGTTTINKSPDEVYGFWRQLENLPTFMAHVDAVRTDGDGRSHWTVSAPFGRTVEWDASTTEDVPGRRLAWEADAAADVPNAGVVEFRPAPGGRGAEVHVRLRYEMPAGRLGSAVARYFGEDPHQQLDDDLRRLKQLLETGEVVRSDGAPGGKRARREFPQHAARPLTDEEYAAEVRA